MELFFEYFSRPEMGILGIVVIACILVIVNLVNRLDKKDAALDKKSEEVKALNQAMNALQERRVDQYSQVVQNDTKFKTELVASVGALQKSIDSIVRVLELRKD